MSLLEVYVPPCSVLNSVFSLSSFFFFTENPSVCSTQTKHGASAPAHIYIYIYQWLALQQRHVGRRKVSPISVGLEPETEHTKKI